MGVGVVEGVAVGAAHAVIVMTLVSSVTAPLRASARPSSVAPVCIAIEVSAMMVPLNVVVVAMVAELPICQ